VDEMKQMSMEDRLQRKKYMELWKRESEMVAGMMRRFPSMVTRYMERKSSKRMGCNSGSYVKPRSKNCDDAV
jgi:hypothetical protein